MKTNFWRLSLAATLLGSSGCDDPLVPIEHIASVRVLGARVEVADAPERAAPAPGERATVRWLVASPEGTPRVGFALAACAAEPTLGSARCASAPFASTVSGAPTETPPELTFTVPADLDVDTTRRLAVLGSICEDELPQGEPETSRCPDGTAGARVSLEFEIAREGDVNTNPDFADPALELDGAPWPSLGNPPADCASGELPSVQAGSGTHTLAISLAENARDALPRENELEPAEESLLVSHFSNGGELERAFSSVTASTPVQVTWSAPKNVGEGGELVRFWFVVRDLRGGSSFTERALCVLP